MNDLYFTAKSKKGLQGRKLSRQTCFYANKFNEILLLRMKSKRVWMKSSAKASDEIKSAIFNLPQGRFHHVEISSTLSGFIPTKADLVEKSTHCLGRQMCAFFWCGRRDLNPYVGIHTPLKRARLPIPPLPRTKVIILYISRFVKSFFKTFHKVFSRCFFKSFY